MTVDFRLFIITGILTTLLLFSTGCMQVMSPAQTPAPTPAVTATGTATPAVTAASQETTTKEEMVAFVREAVAYAQQNPKEKALAEFSSQNGSFFRGVFPGGTLYLCV